MREHVVHLKTLITAHSDVSKGPKNDGVINFISLSFVVHVVLNYPSLSVTTYLAKYNDSANDMSKEYFGNISTC